MAKKNKESVKESKRWIRIKTLPSIDISSMDVFEGTIEEVAEKILNLRKVFIDRCELLEKTYNRELYPDKDKVERISIERDYWTEESDSYRLIYHRLETDEEFNDRLKDEENRKEKQKLIAQKRKETKEKRERTIYENLKSKFESKS